MIALVDCNNFFVSCERLFRPDLQNKPVLVLSSNDGCVVARSSEVKELGIPMGVPYFKVRSIVKRNDIQYFSSNFALYSDVSQRVLGVLSQNAPQIEVYSIDEAFLDLSSLSQQDIQQWADTLQAEVRRLVGIPVSVGVAPTKTLAKIASSCAKKRQCSTILDPKTNQADYESVLANTSIESVWGIGWRLAPRLQKAGINTALRLSRVSEAWIRNLMGVNGVRLLRELRGISEYPLEGTRSPQKTLMVSRSFGHNIGNIHEIETAVATFASKAAYKLRKHEQATDMFGVYLKYKNKDGETKSQTAITRFLSASNDTSVLVQAALELVSRLYSDEYGYKKAGVFAGRVSSSNICQTNLFDTLKSKDKLRRKALMASIDEINSRFGSETVHIGSIDPKITRWHVRKQYMSPAYTTDWSQLPRVHPA